MTRITVQGVDPLVKEATVLNKNQYSTVHKKATVVTSVVTGIQTSRLLSLNRGTLGHSLHGVTAQGSQQQIYMAKSDGRYEEKILRHNENSDEDFHLRTMSVNAALRSRKISRIKQQDQEDGSF